MNIICIDHPFHHHGEHSGYKMLAKFLGAEVVEGHPKPPRFINFFPEKTVNKYLQLHPNWYSKDALIVEWEISKRLFSQSNNVFHFLYGENSFRQTGKVNALTGHKNQLVATYHQIPAFFEQRSKLFSCVRDLDAVVLVSTSQIPFFESIVSSKKLHFIPHGVDVNFFCPSQGLRQPRNKLRCLTVGSNYRDSNLHLNAISCLNKSSLAGKIEFEIIGESYLASVFSGIDNVFYRYGISDDDLLQDYQDADIFLMPLQDSTANNGVLEAMACGLPIVVSDAGGIHDYVDNSFATIVPPHDLDAIVSAVSGLLQNSDQRISMGISARGKAEENFSWNTIVESMKSMYSRLIT